MVIAKTAIVSPLAKLQDDIIVEDLAIIKDGARIGSGTRVQANVIIEEDCELGENCRVGYNAVMRRKTILGDNSVFGTLSVCEGNTRIGSNVTIHSQCHITEGVLIEDCVFIAPFFCGANTKRIVHGRNYPLVKEGYRIKFGARIAIYVAVMPAVVIGKEALVDPCSLVTRDIPDYEHWRGSPARRIGVVPAEERLPPI